MIEKVEKLIKALLCKIEAYTAKVNSIEDCCNGIDRNYVNKDGDSMQGLLELEEGVNFNDLNSGYNGHLNSEDLDDNVTWLLPNASGTIALTSDIFTCDDLEHCPEIIGIKNSIPEDISDLTDNSNLLFDGDYDSLSNKPTIPVVNDGQLELNTSGIATGGTENFSANQSGNTTFTVNVPGTDITLSFNNNILTVSSSTGQSDSIDLSSLATDDTYVTSMSLSGNTLILTNNDGTTVQQDLSSILFDGDYDSLSNKPTFKTVDGQSILGVGDIAVGGLTCEDLENCQEIIDIKDSIPTDVSDLSDNGGILFSGDYDDLTNTPIFKTVDGQSIIGVGNISVGDINVQSDWDEVNPSSDAFIKNKPSIPIVNDGQLELNTSGIATGGTKNFSANQSGNTVFTVDVPGTDIALTFNSNILTVFSSTGQSDNIDLSSLVTVDTYVVSMSLSGNTLILTKNDSTTVQQDLSSILFDGDYNNLSNKPNIPTNNSELVNDSGYMTCEDLETCQEIIDIKDSIPTDVSDLTDNDGKLFDGDYNSLSNTPTFKTVDGQSILGVGDISDPTFRISLTFEDVETDISTAGYNMKIVGVDLKTVGLSETVTVNGSSYTYGSTISKGDRIEIDTNIVGFVIFNCEYI